MTRLRLRLLSDRFAVCRMDPAAIIPAMLLIPGQEFVSISRTADELSLVCPEPLAPVEAKIVKGWRAFKLLGPLDFGLTGVLSSLLTPLAEAKISVFTIATFDTDYILVQEENLEAATAVLDRHAELVD